MNPVADPKEKRSTDVRARSSGGDRSAFHVTFAGICIQITARDNDLRMRPDEATGRFLVSGSRPDAVVTAAWGEPGEADSGKLIFDSGAVWRLYRDGDRHRFVFSSPTLGPLPYKEATFDSDFTHGEVALRRACFSGGEGFWPLEYPLDELLIQGLLARGRGVELHACGVRDREGRGLLLVGQSGAGKTTMARLWQATDGARVLSDDRIIVRRMGDSFVMFGTPWHGEAALAEPASAPLTGIFLLEHRAANILLPVGGSEAAAALFACGFPPFFDREGLDFTLSLFGDMASAVPCHRLGFVPDASVVELLQEWVHAHVRRTFVAPASHLDPADGAFVEVVSEVLGRGNSVRFRATGGSMYPTIREGETITVMPVKPGETRRGDIILYRSGRSVFAHRAVRTTPRADGGDVLLLRGDAAQTYDEPIEVSAVLGRVVAVERDGRTLGLVGWSARIRAVPWVVLRRVWRRLRVRPRAT